MRGDSAECWEVTGSGVYTVLFIKCPVSPIVVEGVVYPCESMPDGGVTCDAHWQLTGTAHVVPNGTLPDSCLWRAMVL